VNKEFLTGRPLKLLYLLYTLSEPASVSVVETKQVELANQLGISRQALNVHLRKLKEQGCIRTGRRFIDVTEKGLALLGVSANPTFVFVRVSPVKRQKAYREMLKLPVQRVFEVAGDMDALLIMERKKLDDVLRSLASLEGVKTTKSYVATQTVK
jgi:DNA-binding Lrp family transcriptional regulator